MRRLEGRDDAVRGGAHCDPGPARLLPRRRRGGQGRRGVDAHGLRGSQTQLIALQIQVNGDDLLSHWPTMSRAQKHSICRSVAGYWDQLLSLHFHATGSLHFANDGTDSGEIVVGPLSMLCSLSTTTYAPPARDKCGPFAKPRAWILAEAWRPAIQNYPWLVAPTRKGLPGPGRRRSPRDPPHFYPGHSRPPLRPAPPARA
ncbi:hypothetical protein B0H15DRAFT_535693 [Mycena belliarum]|uniref:Uncharacterized protein n=1 Tax=Mycena belliarum TaxID=1033014 RepID=A0AAD6TTD6_9AGAR|nr:hypothetical protein B0H15DRAFT_535693 [Mycena belliae]